MADGVEAAPPFRGRRDLRPYPRKTLAEDAAGQIYWTVSVDWTINRAHQHGTNLSRGQGGDWPMRPVVMDAVTVPRPGADDPGHGLTP